MPRYRGTAGTAVLRGVLGSCFPMLLPTAPAAKPGIPGLRWWIAGLIFLATLINFVNRLTISVLAPVIISQLHLSNLQFAGITNSFLIAYTASQALSGKLYDRIGNRRGFSLSIAVWSVASMLHASATGLFSLNCFRFLLGSLCGGGCRKPLRRLDVRVAQRTRVDGLPGAEDGHPLRRGLYVGGAPGGRRPHGGRRAGLHRRGTVRFPDMDQQRTDPAQRLLTRCGRGVGGRARRHGCRHWGDSIY